MQFIPFEDDWDALARLRPEDLVPYRVGMLELEPVEGRISNTRPAVDHSLSRLDLVVCPQRQPR